MGVRMIGSHLTFSQHLHPTTAFSGNPFFDTGIWSQTSSLPSFSKMLTYAHFQSGISVHKGTEAALVYDNSSQAEDYLF